MARGFTVQEKLALMMTSAGSQRRLAGFLGVTHQQIGRWLSIGQTTPSGEPSRVREPTDPDIRAAIDQGFVMHADASRAQALVDRIPFAADVPVYARRLTYEDGRPGQRVVIEHLHRISDALRDRIVASQGKTGFYGAVSARSTVRQVPYWFNTENQIDTRRIRRDANMQAMRERLTPELDEDDGELIDRLQRINTVPTPLSGFPVGASLDDLNRKLATRHAPAVGDKGTSLADELLFQTSTKRDRYGAEHAQERRRERAREQSRKARRRAAAKTGRQAPAKRR